MGFSVRTTEIAGLLIIELKEVGDARGTVREFFRASAFAEADAGHLGSWRQINVTESRRGALRGLHGEAMNKLVGIVAGDAFGAYVDARRSSPTFGVTVSAELRAGVQVLVPRGVCNGFQTLSESSQYLYAFDEEWQPGMAGVKINALDPNLGISWPLPVDTTDPAQISPQDAGLPNLADAVL